MANKKSRFISSCLLKNPAECNNLFILPTYEKDSKGRLFPSELLLSVCRGVGTCPYRATTSSMNPHIFRITEGKSKGVWI
jgi:hypothetical protein